MEKRGGQRMRFKIRQYGVVSKYRDCEHVHLSGRSIRLLNPAEMTEFTRRGSVIIDRKLGNTLPDPPSLTRRCVV